MPRDYSGQNPRCSSFKGLKAEVFLLSYLKVESRKQGEQDIFMLGAETCFIGTTFSKKNIC